MDFTNINDPAGVKALLDQLRTSQAWQELSQDSSLFPPSNEHTPYTINPQNSVPDASLPPKLGENPESQSPFVSEHISSLLSRLRPDGGSKPSPAPQRQSAPPPPPNHNNAVNGFTQSGLSKETSPQARNPRSLNFNQMLPVIARLSEDPLFIEKLEKMHEEQERLERRLWGERQEIIRTQHERVKVAQAKAAILGTGLSQSDTSSMRSTFQEELDTFDREQVLPAWDTLIVKQQDTLESLGVPGMFVTSQKADREKQQRIAQVLDGLVGTEDDGMKP